MGQSPVDQDEQSIMDTRLRPTGGTEPPATPAAKETDRVKAGETEPAAIESALLPGYPVEGDGLIGKKLGSYLILGELGSGGMAVVYKARHLMLDRIVAIKEIQRNFCQEPRFLKRFKSEARTAARILHPHVVTLYEHLYFDCRHFLVLEYVPGGTLYDQWKDRPMPINEALRVLDQLLNGLEAIHSEQIVHRDLKPQNVMIDARGNLKIGDFGLAHLVGDKLSTVMGTVRYMAPEACSSDQQGIMVDQRVDIYALGLMMYEFLLGPERFNAVMANQSTWYNSVGGWLIWHCNVEARLPRLDAVSPDIAAPLASIVEKMVEKDYNRRYASVAEILEDLRKLDVTQPVAQPAGNKQATLATEPVKNVQGVQSSTTGVEQKLWSPKWGIVALAALGLMLLVGLLVWRAGHGASERAIPTEAPTTVSAPADMILVPAGPFEMGTDRGTEQTRGDAWPKHRVYLDTFYIDKTEVTNRQYRAFCDATGRAYPENPTWDPNYFLGSPNYPVVGVSWQDARDYAAWAHKRLPTEAEWEKAARGPEGYRWPWGNSAEAKVANLDGGEDGFIHTAPVGSFARGASPYGALDMIGNVWEWVEDRYGPYPGGRDLPVYHQDYRVVRGGGYENGSAGAELDAAFRGFAPADVQNEMRFTIGFRCAADAPKK